MTWFLLILAVLLAGAAPGESHRLAYGEAEYPAGINGLTPENPSAVRINELLHASPLRGGQTGKAQRRQGTGCQLESVLVEQILAPDIEPGWISFTLKGSDAATWSDGKTPFTPRDINATLKLLAHPNTRPLAFPYNTFIARGVEGVALRFDKQNKLIHEAGGQNQTIYLSKLPVCRKNAATFKVIPHMAVDRDYIDAQSAYPDEDDLVSGPYRQDYSQGKKWKTADLINLVRNLHHPLTPSPPKVDSPFAPVDAITMHYYIRRELMIRDFSEGPGSGIQIIPELSLIEFAELKRSLGEKRVAAEPYFSNRAHAFVFNVEEGRMLHDLELRQYVARVFNKRYAFHRYYGAAQEGVAMHGPFLPKTVEDPAIKPQNFMATENERRQARTETLPELLQTEDADPTRSLLTLRFISRETQDERLQKLIRQFREDLKQAGIALKGPPPVRHKDWHTKLYFRRDFDIALVDYVAPHPISVLMMFSQRGGDLRPGGRNLFGYRNAQLGRLIEDVLAGRSHAADLATYRKIHRLAHDATLGIWLWQDRASAAYRSDLIDPSSLHVRDVVFFGQPEKLRMKRSLSEPTESTDGVRP